MKDNEFLFHYHEVEYIKWQYEKFGKQPLANSLTEIEVRQQKLKDLGEEESRIRVKRRNAWNDFISENGLVALYTKMKKLELEHNFDTYDMIYFNACAVFRIEKMLNEKE